MSLYPKKFRLPDEPTIKDINAYKKRLNWGEVPAFFHLIANAIAEAEGFINYGFDNAYKRITNRRNWNYDKLGVDEDIELEQVDHIEHLEPLSRPRISLYHVFNRNGYELLAFPYVNDIIIDEYRKDDPKMDFKIWDPSSMKVLVRIGQLHKFIAFEQKSGDNADTALIIHAYSVVNQIIEMLEQEVDVHKIKGISIKAAYAQLKSNPDLDASDVIKSQIDLEDIDS
jgi:hypothetical protein